MNHGEYLRGSRIPSLAALSTKWSIAKVTSLNVKAC
jgi:hypothetical protein